MIDGDEADDKIIAVLEDDAMLRRLARHPQCPRALVERLRHYFLTYKQAPTPPDSPSRSRTSTTATKPTR